MCGSLIPVFTSTKWQTYESKDGGFKVELPAAVRQDVTVRGTNPNQKLSYKIEGTHLWNRNEDYAVLYKDIDSAEKRKGNTKIVIQETINEFAKAGLASNGRGGDFVMNGFPATEIKFQNNFGGKYTVHVIVADARLFILLVGKNMGFPDEENAKRFFNSFAIIDESATRGEERGRVALLGKDLTEGLFRRVTEDLLREQELIKVEQLGKVLTENLLKKMKKEKGRID